MATTTPWLASSGPHHLIGLITLVLMCPPAAAEDSTQTLVLRVFNYAQVPVFDLQAAEEEATRIYHAAGISLVWVNPGAPPNESHRDALHLTVVLLNGVMAQRKIFEDQLGADILGRADQVTRRAYLFSHRISAVAAERSVDVVRVLGRVLAHEIGHMVLPEPGHAERGIMREKLDLSITPQRFTPEQTRVLHDTIAASLADKHEGDR